MGSTLLNQGEKLNKKQLAEEFNVHTRTISRDLDERLSFLPFFISDNTYSLPTSYLGKFNVEDINRFAKFASVKDLFGKIDQVFFQKYLTDSITIKSYQAESIAHKQQEFDVINDSIQKKQKLNFLYQRVNQKDDKSIGFEVEPYKLVNNLGIWYLVAIHDYKIKVFSITRISLPKILNQSFTPNSTIIETIENGDGIYFEGVIDEVILKVSAKVAVYCSESEGANYWLSVLTDLHNRGLQDILIACVDGLKGFPEAIQSIFPNTEVQLCVIHQIRNSIRYVASKDQKAFMRDLKPVYKAINKDSAELALDELDRLWGSKYPAVIASWRDKWHLLSAYFKYPEAVRKPIYTTNAAPAVHRQFRKLTKTKGAFPNETSLLKLLYVGMLNASEKWTMPINNWRQTMMQLSIHFPGRLDAVMSL